MALTKEQIQTAADILKGLYERLLVHDVPEDAPYRGYLAKDQPFGLDNPGYYETYAALISFAFSIGRVGDLWSEDAVQQRQHDLLEEFFKTPRKERTKLFLSQILTH